MIALKRSLGLRENSFVHDVDALIFRYLFYASLPVDSFSTRIFDFDQLDLPGGLSAAGSSAPRGHLFVSSNLSVLVLPFAPTSIRNYSQFLSI